MEEPVTYLGLEARLEDRDKALMAAVVFDDQSQNDSDCLEQAWECLHQLEASNKESEKAVLRQKIKEAERAGNLPEALRIAGELQRLERG
jgi:hypothetical protein